MRKIILLLAMGAALTTQTIFAQVPSYVPTDGLVGYWPFSGNANDESGNGNNGTNNGATLTTDRFGNTNSSYNFNGTNNYISLPIGFTTGSASKSFSVWFYLANGTYNFVLDGGTSVNGSSFGLFWNTNPTINKLTFHGDGATYDYEFADINFNQWYHTVITYDGTTVKSYLNGVYIGSKIVTLNTSTTSNIKVGSRNNTSAYFLGKIDDIGVWNRALTEQEITNLYNANQCFNLITVTDTLIINVGQLSYNNPVTYANNITMAPNPASSQININFNNITDLNGGTLKVINSLGQEVATTPITTSGTNSTMQLATWGGTGMYFVQIINPQGQIVDIKKIILQ